MCLYVCMYVCMYIYMHSYIQDVTGGKVSILGVHNIGHSKQKSIYVCTCVPFRTVSEMELFHCTVPKLLIRKRYCLLFLIPVFIVQVTKLHSATRVRTWRFARVHSVHSEIALSRKLFGIGHMYIYNFFA
jgi:hypothetical protein